MINQFSYAPRFLTSTRLWLALVVLLAGSFSISVAQEQPAPVEADGAPAAALFEELPIIERFGSTARQTNGKSVIKIKLGKDEALEATDWEFFDGYFFAEMTHLDKLGELDKKRIDFFKNYVNRAKTIPHKNLVDFTWQKMEEISIGNFHPVVRFNALLIIGQLNSKEFDGIRRTEAQPLPAALDVLIAQLEKPDQMDALQLAAWVGILRHTTHDRYNKQVPGVYQIEEEKTTRIRNQAIALLQQRQPSADRSLAGHVWLQRRAIEVLGTLGNDPGERVIKEITFYTSDENSPMSLRLTAARSLADFNYDAQTRIDAVGEAHALGALAAQACRNEIQRVENSRRRKNERQAFGGSGMGMGMEMGSRYSGSDSSGSRDLFGGSTAAELKPEEARRVQLTRRRLKYQLFHIQQGLGTDGDMPSGLMAAADAQGKAEVRKVVDAVDGIMEQLKEPELTPRSGNEKRRPIERVKLDDMIKDVRKQTRALENHVNKAKELGQPGVDPAPPVGDGPGVDAPGSG